MWPWGGLGLSGAVSGQVAGFSNIQFWSVAFGTEFWVTVKLVVFGKHKRSWKGISAQVATQNVCDLCVSAVRRESSCPNFYLHSQMMRANSFSWPCIFGGPFLCPDPRCGWNWKWFLCEKCTPHSLVCSTATAELRPIPKSLLCAGWVRFRKSLTVLRPSYLDF